MPTRRLAAAALLLATLAALTGGGRPASAERTEVMAASPASGPAQVPRPSAPDRAARAQVQGDGPAPRVVTVNVSITEFGGYSDLDATFDVVGYLYASWNDPALAAPSAPAVRRPKEEEVWTPKLIIANALDFARTADTGLKVDPAGTVEQHVRFRARVKALVDVRRFPFDDQAFTIAVESTERTADELTFSAEASELEVEGHAELPGWTIREVRSSIKEHYLEESRHRIATFEGALLVSRNRAFFVWKILVPLVLFVVVALTAAWIDPKQVAAQNAAMIAALLTAVAFNFTVAGSQPRVAYLTLYDVFNLLCLTTIVLAFVLVGISHALEHRERAERLAGATRSASKYVVPLYFLGGTLAIAAAFSR
jgi:hypothetical protein